jgi:hypothetical protein
VSWSQNFPNTFDGTTQTNQVLKNTDNETKRLYAILSQIHAADGHAHTGNGSDGKKINAADVVNAPTGGISATTAQAAIDELNTKKVAKGELVVNVKDYGAVGDGVTDDTVAIQAAFDSIDYGTIYFPAPAGSYKISNTITFKQGHRIQGASRSGVTITMLDDTKYAFEYNSAILANGYDVDSGIVFEHLKISAKYGIKINQSGDYATIFSKQGAVKSPVFRQIEISGKYLTINDPNKNTSIQATKTELMGYGCGISFAKVLDAKIESSLIRWTGIGIYFDGCDINTIDTCRINTSARYFHNYRHDTWGSQNKIKNCDLLNNMRYGGIYLEEGAHMSIVDNYFENYTASACQIQTINDFGTVISDNRFDEPGQASTPIMDLSPQYGLNISNNRWTPSGPDPISKIQINGTYWSTVQKVIGKATNNTRQFPKVDFPCVLTADRDDYVFKYNNIPSNYIGGAGAATFPFITSPLTGRWVLNTATSSVITRFTLKSPGHRKFLVKMLGRKIGGAGGFHTVKYNETGFTETTIFSGSVNIANTTEVEEKMYTLKIPDTAKGIGYIQFELVNTEVEWERIELIPVDYELGTAAPSTGAYLKGDKVFNTNPAPSGFEGWVCITAGSPGTWKGFGVIQA